MVPRVAADPRAAVDLQVAVDPRAGADPGGMNQGQEGEVLVERAQGASHRAVAMAPAVMALVATALVATALVAARPWRPIPARGAWQDPIHLQCRTDRWAFLTVTTVQRPSR